jgi:hypothetical protein
MELEPSTASTDRVRSFTAFSGEFAEHICTLAEIKGLVDLIDMPVTIVFKDSEGGVISKITAIEHIDVSSEENPGEEDIWLSLSCGNRIYVSNMPGMSCSYHESDDTTMYGMMTLGKHGKILCGPKGNLHQKKRS